MEGRKLSLFPSSQTTYKEFKRLYPRGLLLRKAEKGKEGSQYDSYYADNSKLGIFGRVDNFHRLPGKEQIFGLRLPCKNIAISKRYLSENNYAWVECKELAVLITYNKNNRSVAAFQLENTDKSYLKNYQIKNDRIMNKKNDVVWNAFTGSVEAGDAEQLKVVPVITAYWFAWVSFFADTELVN